VSSAILYVAIVVIWACVLIPRWLRRDSARGSVQVADQAAPGDMAPPADVVPAAEVAPPDADSERNEVQMRREERPEEYPEEIVEEPPPQDEAPSPLTPEESRRRVLSARRRLLGLLIVLEAAAISLAVLKLAALWVVIPPSIMLAGYLLILREASQADAERAAWEAEAAARAQARARNRARAREGVVRHGKAGSSAATGWAPPVPSAAPAAQYEDAGPGRDFAPGLAGKYTTSTAEIIDITARAGDDLPQESPDSKLRAVGD
jgi:hypothetical protein